jgi:hypothetical protein
MHIYPRRVLENKQDLILLLLENEAAVGEIFRQFFRDSSVDIVMG